MTHNVNAPGAPVRHAQATGEDFAHTPQFEWLARAGLVSRGVIYAVIGVLAIKLALGLDGALAALERASYGPVLLGIVAAGLIGFAAYSVADARFRRV